MKILLLVNSLITLLFPREVVAVLNLEPEGLSNSEAKILTQRLTSKMIALDKYVVVERNSVNKILEEQKFQNSGLSFSIGFHSNFELGNGMQFGVGYRF